MTAGAPAGPSEAAAVIRLDGGAESIRDLNRAIRSALAEGHPVGVSDPGARHNLGVALLRPGSVRIAGSVGYYCAGMNDGASVEVDGSAGWGLAEGMLSGTVVVRGNAGNGAAASIRGGTVVVHGDCAARAGIAMKGGALVVAGDVGYMAAFMMQKGLIVICGDAGEALADSMYEGVVFVGGSIASLGNDAVVEAPSPDDERMLDAVLGTHGIARPARFRKVVSGRKLWNFTTHELETWRAAL
jgi:glutamate synthase domain-containing protein 3